MTIRPTRLQLVGLMMMTICYTHYAVQWSITDVVMRFIQSLLYSVYLQPVCNSVIFELSNRIRSIIKLLTSAKSRPNETDNEPFHKKIDLSTAALAMSTTQGSDLRQNSREQDCCDKTKISDVRKPNLLLYFICSPF